MRPSGCTCSAAISRSPATASHRPPQRSTSARCCARSRSSSQAGATANDPDSITVFFGGSASLSTPVAVHAELGRQLVRRPGPRRLQRQCGPQEDRCGRRSPGRDVHGVDDRRRAVSPSTRRPDSRRSRVTPVAGNLGATYPAVTSSLVNLGPAESMGRIAYTVDADARTRCARRSCFPTPIRSRRW